MTRHLFLLEESFLPGTPEAIQWYMPCGHVVEGTGGLGSECGRGDFHPGLRVAAFWLQVTPAERSAELPEGCLWAALRERGDKLWEVAAYGSDLSSFDVLEGEISDAMAAAGIEDACLNCVTGQHDARADVYCADEQPPLNDQAPSRTEPGGIVAIHFPLLNFNGLGLVNGEIECLSPPTLVEANPAFRHAC